jgi:hypothetical protein
MNEQQARNLRADQIAANARRITADTTRVIKGQRDREANARLRARNSAGENVPHHGIGVGKFILVFLVIGIVLFALFALFVLIVSGLKSSPFG